MRKLEELEDRWVNYKAKKIFMPIFKISSLYLVAVSLYYVYDKKENLFPGLSPSHHMTKVLGVSMDTNNSVMAKVIDKETKKEEVEIKVIDKETKKEEVEILEKVSFVPVIPVIDMEKEEGAHRVKKRVKPKRKHVPKSKKHSSKPRLVKAKPNAYLTPNELGVMGQNNAKILSVQKPHKTKKMNFTSTSVNYVEKIKSKFSKSSNPRDALILAKLYYKNKNFEEAEKWALSANKLNNSLEDSWFLFAKSKVKLGKKEEALKILVSYYKKSNSMNAKRLIMQIKTGKI